MKVLRYLLLSCCALTEVAMLIFGFLGLSLFTGDYRPDVPPGMVLSWTAGSAALIAITLVSFYRVRKDKKYPVLTGLLQKIPVALLTMGFIFFSLEIPEAGWLMLILALFLAGVVILLPILSDREEKSRQAARTAQIPKFLADKAEWSWDDALAEYLRLKGRPVDRDAEEGNKALAEYSGSMSENEIDKLYAYAGAPIAYFLGWLVKRELVSEAFLSLHSPEIVQAVREERTSPVDLLQNMDYVLSREDIRQEAQRFADLYYEMAENYTPFNSHSRKYFFDYYKEVCSGFDVPRYYCVDFDWDRFHRLETVLDRRYREFTSPGFDENEMVPDERKLRTQYFDGEAGLCHEPGTQEEYVALCADAYENMSDALRKDLAEHLLEFCQDELTEEEMETENVLRKFKPSKVVVMKPEDAGAFPVPAYVVLGDSEWEEEHGAAFTVIGDFVVCSTYYADAESPWQERYMWKYRIHRDARSGKYCVVDKIPVNFGGSGEAADQLTVPVAAAECKKETDLHVEALYVLKMAEKYECSVTYDGERPNYMFVSAEKGNIRTFSDSIPLT